MMYTKEPTMNYDSDALKTLPEETAASFALDTEEIKGHNVYFVKFDEPFGYSCLVYKDGRIMPYAGDMALHHNGMDRVSLRSLYLRCLDKKLFTEEELIGPIKTYDEYCVKLDYLRNHYSYLRDHVSIFYNRPCAAGSPQQKEEDARIEKESEGKTFDPIGLGWYEDASFVHHHVALLNAVEAAKKAMETDYDFCYDAFRREMDNHEYPINWQGNWDVLSCFGDIKYDNDNDDQDLAFYFDQLGFNNTQRRAYRDARRYTLSHYDG